MDQILRHNFSIEKKRRTASHLQTSYHFHSYFEYYYMVDGECRFFIHDRIYYLQKGDLLIIAPGDHHLNIYDKCGFHDRFLIRFLAENVEQSVLELGSLKEKLLSRSHKISISKEYQPVLESFFSKMLSEYLSNSDENDVKLHYQFQELLINIYQDNLEHDDTVANTYMADGSGRSFLSSSDYAIETAAKYIVHNSNQNLCLNDVAKIAGLTPTYFSKKFKTITGLCFKDYLNHVRLRRATTLLMETNDSISQISAECGFSSSNYFGDVFRLAYGISPRAYRKS